MIKKLIIAGIATLMSVPMTFSQQFPEKLNRGAVIMAAGRIPYLSWRSFSTDSPEMYFDIYRDGKKINKEPITNATDYSDSSGKLTQTYTIKAMIGDNVVEEFSPMKWAPSKQLQLNLPAGGKTPSGEEYTYTPNDCSVGDVDGDGEYELIVKWYPSNAKDNSQGGYTGNTILDCYEFDGTLLWRVDLGINIRSGAHYTQFMVYDFDGDGKAEMICKTGPGSVDGTGAYVNGVADIEAIKNASNTKDWRNSGGRVDGGQEWLTVFDGPTGKAVHTVYYNPNRNQGLGGEASGTFNWGTGGKNDTGAYGNRGERYLAAVAYLDGSDANPSAVMCRGYYDYAFLWAVDFDGEKLSTRWLHAAKSTTQYTVTDGDGKTQTYSPPQATRGAGSRTAYSNGNHNLTVGDVDGDGKDEIVWGACAIDDNGKLLYATGYGHGDAIHLGKMIPGREGLQVYDIHEASPYGWDLHDAATGEILFSGTATGDTGRGIAADIDPRYDGYEMWCSSHPTPRSAATGTTTSSATPSQNFRIYWDGDLQDELLDGSGITKWVEGKITSLASLTGSSCNGSKKTPCLSADIFGDWREEVILWYDRDPSKIYIHSTTIASEHRVPCLMEDRTYRMAICWQNVAYNQPPHLGYYLPEYAALGSTGVENISVDKGTGTFEVYTTGGIKVLDGKGSVWASLSTLTPGVYIVRYPEGRTEKIIRH
ncbi:MAG: rhamnogalacturonan lyase [Muribaculaceae bacterium]|nr:rhamnogalacturonan lyase [Muribaculaceae bacterium]